MKCCYPEALPDTIAWIFFIDVVGNLRSLDAPCRVGIAIGRSRCTGVSVPPKDCGRVTYLVVRRLTTHFVKVQEHGEV